MCHLFKPIGSIIMLLRLDRKFFALKVRQYEKVLVNLTLYVVCFICGNLSSIYEMHCRINNFEHTQVGEAG